LPNKAIVDGIAISGLSSFAGANDVRIVKLDGTCFDDIKGFAFTTKVTFTFVAVLLYQLFSSYNCCCLQDKL